MDTKKRFWIEDEFIDTQILKHKLSPKAALAFIVLSRYVNREGKCAVGVRTIAKKTGMSERSAWRAMKELRRCQFVSVWNWDMLTKKGRGAVKLSAIPLSDLQHKELGITRRNTNDQNSGDDKITSSQPKRESYLEKMSKGYEQGKAKVISSVSDLLSNI